MNTFKVGDRVRLIKLDSIYEQKGLVVGQQTGVVTENEQGDDPVCVDWRGFTNGHPGNGDNDSTSHWYVPPSFLEKVPFIVGDSVKVVGPDWFGEQGIVERHCGPQIPWLINSRELGERWFKTEELELIEVADEALIATRTIVDLAEEYTGRYITVENDTIRSEWDTYEEAFDEAVEAAEEGESLAIYKLEAVFECEIPAPTITVVTQA